MKYPACLAYSLGEYIFIMILIKSGQARKKIIHWLLAGIAGIVVSACGRPVESTANEQPAVVPAGVVPVQVRHSPRGYELLRGGRPYFLRGGAGLQQLDKLRAAGGNTIRLWSTDYAAPLLEQARQQGLSVMLGLWVQPEGPGFSYFDPQQVAAQQARLRQQVLQFRRHPALLMWNIGNELELHDPNPRLFAALNDLARMIHALDPYHPVTLSMSNITAWGRAVKEQVPAVDVLSVNVYGRLGRLPQLLAQSSWTGPYIVTEYGGRGYWESDSTAWEAPREQTSAAKADFVRARYGPGIRDDSTHCLGGYAFFWGSKHELTPTWFSLFEPTGEKTELVDELQFQWRGTYPPNRAPHLTSLTLGPYSVDGPDARLLAGQTYPAAIVATDPDGDSLQTRWELRPEVASNLGEKVLNTPTEPVPGAVPRAAGLRAEVRMPSRPGAYRLYARIFDGHGSVGTANIPV